ncbi:hypothetical protein PDE_01158 [Penicillium oxalicum 114-2]|uniref:Uncharacterized protein n=1 Tax=Penicillium oxalicum (strain 114-2 / CGMCC 5302) TaxID=933388 RepID=S8AWG7_PENO1|nr:hypothetical protein PDE_01158 [Penicillium oxalicum 114-2]
MSRAQLGGQLLSASLAARSPPISSGDHSLDSSRMVQDELCCHSVAVRYPSHTAI